MKKKVLSGLLALALVMGTLTGCGSSSTSNSETKETTPAKDTATEQTTEETTKEEQTTEEAAVTEQTDLYVFIASSLSNAMKDIQTLFNKSNPDVNILINAESSGTLQTQIEEGATCDIFFSAATKQMTALEEGKLVVDGTVKNLLENQVVMIKATGTETSVTGFEDITNASSLALAGEDVPVGQYAREIFTSLGNIDDVLAMEINEGANVTAVLTAVSEKSNEVGVVYKTDAASMPDDVEIIATAPEGSMEKPAIYPVGQIVNPEATDAETAAAKSFLEFLSTDEALAVFESYGFTIYTE